MKLINNIMYLVWLVTGVAMFILNQPISVLICALGIQYSFNNS